MIALGFRLDIRSPERRRIGVELDLDVTAIGAANDREGGAPPVENVPRSLDLFLPSWTPGSYMIREFARHLGPVTARDAERGTTLRCAKTSKNRFRIALAADTRRVRVAWSVYAHELTVRTADVTAEHAFWNHACVLLWPVGSERASARIAVQLPSGWMVATSLPRADGDGGAVPGSVRDAADEHVFVARDLDHAMDSPCLAGRFRTVTFEAGGVTHELALDGLGAIEPKHTFAADVKAIVEESAAVFGGSLPYSSYRFLCLFTQDGHGGLEHADSTVLLSSRTAMRGGKAYQDFLALVAHEHFHAWNVKRMRPVELWRYDYEVENYTPLLWLVEGFTAYYDDLLCLRAGVLREDEYLAILGKGLTTTFGGTGRLVQSLADASFDAWIRLYRPDENTRNSTQNYYGNGAVAALCLDLAIRRGTNGGKSLDDALRALWTATFAQGRGYTRDDVVAALRAAAGADLAPLLASLVDGPLDPDLQATFAPFGVRVLRGDRDKPHLGLSFEPGTTVVASVGDDGPCAAAGIAPGDELLALDGVRVTSDRWGEVFPAVAAVGRLLKVLTSSRGLVVERTVAPIEPPVGTITLELDAHAPPAAVALRRGWFRSRAAQGPEAAAPGAPSASPSSASSARPA